MQERTVVFRWTIMWVVVGLSLAPSLCLTLLPGLIDAMMPTLHVPGVSGLWTAPISLLLLLTLSFALVRSQWWHFAKERGQDETLMMREEEKQTTALDLLALSRSFQDCLTPRLRDLLFPFTKRIYLHKSAKIILALLAKDADDSPDSASTYCGAPSRNLPPRCGLSPGRGHRATLRAHPGRTYKEVRVCLKQFASATVRLPMEPFTTWNGIIFSCRRLKKLCWNWSMRSCRSSFGGLHQLFCPQAG